MQDGFSLLEVVIALTLLSLIAAGMGQAMVRGQEHARVIEQDRAVRSACQSVLMELAKRNWSPSTTVGTIEYMRNNSPLSFQLSQFPGESGIATITDVSTTYPEKVKSGSIYKIEVTFRQQSLVTYVVNVP